MDKQSIILPLITRYLIKEGLVKSARRLQREYGKDLDLTEAKYNIHKKKLKHIINKYIENKSNMLDKIKEPKIENIKDSKDEQSNDAKSVKINKKDKTFEIKSKKITKNKPVVGNNSKNLNSFNCEKLEGATGRNFRKEKNKLKKRQTFTGGAIFTNVVEDL